MLFYSQLALLRKESEVFPFQTMNIGQLRFQVTVEPRDITHLKCTKKIFFKQNRNLLSSHSNSVHPEVSPMK